MKEAPRTKLLRILDNMSFDKVVLYDVTTTLESKTYLPEAAQVR